VCLALKVKSQNILVIIALFCFTLSMVGCDGSLSPEEKRRIHEANEKALSEYLEKNYPGLAAAR
jgi:hypothetical protein